MVQNRGITHHRALRSRKPRRRLALALSAVTALLALGAASPAHAVPGGASFIDPDARAFTLAPLGGSSDPLLLAGLPDGGVVIGGRRATRLWLDGHVSRVPAADGARAIAVESAGAILVSRPQLGVVERIELASGTAAVAAMLPRVSGSRGAAADVNTLVPLGNGITLASDRNRIWAITPVGGVGRVSLPGVRSLVDDIVVLAGGRLLANGDDGLVLTGFGMAPRRLRGPVAGVAATGDGRAVVSLSADARGGEPTFALVTPDGTMTSLGAPTTPVLGAGDGLPGPVPMPAATSGLTVAGDGTLLFASDGGLRGLVPAGSLRARVAFTQRAYETFGAGLISYFAPVPGRIEIEVMRGEQTVDRVSGVANSGEGEVALSRPPGRATYRVRVRLTGTAGIAAAVATMDTRAVLPTKEARAALQTFESSHGDDAGAVGSMLGPCVRESARAVSCLVLDFVDGVAFDTTGDVFHRDVPAARATATLRADGVVTAWLPFAVRRRPASLKVGFARRQSRRALALRIRAGQAADAEAVASVAVPGRSTPVTVRATRRLGRDQTWRLRLRMPRAVIAAAARRPLTATVKVTLRRDVGPGIATTWQTSRLTLV